MRFHVKNISWAKVLFMTYLCIVQLTEEKAKEGVMLAANSSWGNRMS